MGLALGAGGVLGGAWLAGALAAISRETGWDPRSASRILGTSAGAVFAALTASGVPASALFPPLSDDRHWLLTRLANDSNYRLPARWPSPRPGSWQLILSGLRPSGLWPAVKLLGGFLPQGVVSTRPIRQTIRETVRSGWAPHPSCWVVACDYRTGARVAFGKAGSPRTDLASAVAASCAIPGFFHPVLIRGHAYVDGGLHSPSNLDLLAGEGLDLVICLNPLSARSTGAGWDHPIEKAGEAIHWLAGHEVDAEAGILRAQGTKVLLLEPTAADVAARGPNHMDARRCRAVFEVALRAVTRQLREPAARALLQRLPRPAMRLPA